MFECKRQGAVDVICGADAMIAERLEQLSELLEECLGRGQPRAVLVLQDVPLIDSAGLELMLDFQVEFEQRGGALKLAALNPLGKELFSVTGVADHFEIYSDAKSAVGSFLQ